MNVISEKKIHSILLESVQTLLEYEDRGFTNDDEPLFWEFESKYDKYYVLNEFKKGGRNQIWYPLINPYEYKRALSEFVRYGELVRFPKERVFRWIGICLKNIALLYACTDLAGHTDCGSNCVEEVVETFFGGEEEEFEQWCEEHGEDCDLGGVWAYLVEIGFEDWFDSAPTAPYSDYGLKPLMKLAASYKEDMSAEQALVLVNKILDVVHCRGDLAALFIHGGQHTLWKISN